MRTLFQKTMLAAALALTFCTAAFSAGQPNTQYHQRIQNKWYPDQHLHVQNGPIESGAIQAGWWSAQWIAEPVPGTNAFRFKNRWKSDVYLHIQDGPLTAGAIQPGWWSAMWEIEPVDGEYSRLRNRWKPTIYIHNQNGRAEAGAIQPGWWSAQWKFVSTNEAVAGAAPGGGDSAAGGDASADAGDDPVMSLAGVDSATTERLVQWAIGEMGRQEQPVCWKKTYGNTAGRPLSSCPVGKVKEGLLCYTPCRAGYRSDGALRCYRACPSGTSTSPGFCHYKFGSIGSCPSPLSGLKPACINDNAYGRSVGTPMTCSGGEVQKGALCYPPCDAGYDHGGPVCWKRCGGAHGTDCGAMCGKSAGVCVGEVANMVLSVSELAANIAGVALTGGTANAGIAAAKTAARAGQKLAAKQALKSALRAARGKIADKLQKRVGAQVLSYATRRSSQTGRQVLEAYAKSVLDKAADRIAMTKITNDAPDLREIAEMVDPTGVVAVVNAFDKPMCSEKPMP